MKKLIILTLILGSAVFLVQTCTKADYYYNYYGNGVYNSQQTKKADTGNTITAHNNTAAISVYQQAKYGTTDNSK